MKLLGVWTYKTHLNEMLFLWDSQFHYTNTLYKLLHFIILYIKQLNSCATSSDILMTCYIVLSILYLILFVCIAYWSANYYSEVMFEGLVPIRFPLSVNRFVHELWSPFKFKTVFMFTLSFSFVSFGEPFFFFSAHAHSFLF